MAWNPAMETAFHPKTVAMVGISANARRDDAWGPRGSSFVGCFEQLGFTGQIYIVNPNTTEIMGYRSFPTVSAIPGQVDLVIISVPATALPGVLEDCATANARNIHILTSGFEETGEPEGLELGKRVREIVQRHGLRVMGPNCMGVYSPEAGVASFKGVPGKSGPAAFISQSGGHCNWFFHYGTNYGVYFKKGVSFGNAYGPDSTDYLEYFAADPDVRLICMYLEGLRDGRRLVRLVSEINRTKPVILWKGGLTESGSRAVASHTASLAGEAAIWRGFYAQTGAIPVSSLEEMAEMAMTVLHVPPPQGKRVALLGLGGGTSVSSADACSREGLLVPTLTTKSQDQLKEFVPPMGSSIRNPLDTGFVFANAAHLKRELDIVNADPMIDMLIVMPHLDFARNHGQLERMLEILDEYCHYGNGKPTVIVFQSFANDPWEREARARLEIELPQKGIPVYNSLTAASRALSRLAEYHRIQREITSEAGRPASSLTLA